MKKWRTRRSGKMQVMINNNNNNNNNNLYLNMILLKLKSLWGRVYLSKALKI